MANLTRRKFLEFSSLTAAGVAVSSLPIGAAYAKRKKVAPSDQVNIALVGCRGVGWANLQSHLRVDGVNCIGLCDVDQNILDERQAGLKKITNKKAKEYGDYRKLLENKDLDAIIVATPDHWHALPMIHGCEAEKDVYVEKPLANYIHEAELMIKASKKYNRVVQVGQQQRSGQHWIDAVNYVHSGKLGKVRSVKAWAFLDWKDRVPVQPDQPAPEGVDYDMWLGPAPERPFNPNRFHFTFRWFWDYAGGLMTDWGVHMLDIVLWAMKAGGPQSVMASGGKFAFPNDAMQTPDTMSAIYQFDDFLMQWEHTIGIARSGYGPSQGVAFIGENGTLVASRGGWELLPEYDRKSNPDILQYKLEQIPKQGRQGNPRDQHAQNFVDCIKSRETPICDIENGANVAINAHLGNISYRLGRKVYWDRDKNKFINDNEANEMLVPEYRDPWKLPNL